MKQSKKSKSQQQKQHKAAASSTTECLFVENLDIKRGLVVEPGEIFSVVIEEGQRLRKIVNNTRIVQLPDKKHKRKVLCVLIEAMEDRIDVNKGQIKKMKAENKSLAKTIDTIKQCLTKPT